MSIHERAVLGLLLEHHPALLSVDEVLGHLAPQSAAIAERDAIEEAIGALVQAGVAHRLERFVFAAAATVYIDGLGES
jgi:hypothetical protein